MTRRYNFNTAFAPLPVLDQGSSPTCVDHVRANIVNAFMRVWCGRVTTWDVDKVQWANAGSCDYVASTPAGPRQLHNGNSDSLVPQGTPAEIKRLLRTNGVAELGVPGRCRTFARAWGRRTAGKFLMPVIDFEDNNGPTAIDHDVLAIGYTRKGVIVLNSWGPAWGKKGLAVLTWDFIRKYGCVFTPYGFDEHPVGSVVLPA